MSRKWCFTLNNYSEEEVETVKEIDCRYMVFGKEEGECGTPHLQGFIYFNCVKRMPGLKKLIPRAHFEQARGSVDQNVEYCSKEGETFEKGDKPVSQKRKGELNTERYEATWELAKKGKFEDIPADIRLKCYRTLKDIRKDYMERPDDNNDVCGVWIHGRAGVGKSRKAREDYPLAYMKMANKWWCGYQEEDYVILDDLDKKHEVLGHHLKIWSDRYGFLAETKGGTLFIRPKVICVTSQFSIEDIWEDEETRQALKRRFKEIFIE